MKLAVYGAAVVLGTIVALFLLTWLLTLLGIIGPQNVKAQWQFAYDYDNSLRAIAGNVCQARADEAKATTDIERNQRTSQRIAQETNYRRVEAQYDAQLQDAFRAKLVKPADVPTQAPTLAEATSACPSSP